MNEWVRMKVEHRLGNGWFRKDIMEIRNGLWRDVLMIRGEVKIKGRCNERRRERKKRTGRERE